jgi:hypothetical protein
MRGERHPTVLAWVAAQPRALLYTTHISDGEAAESAVMSCRSQFSRPVMRALQERTFAHTTPHPIGARQPSITQFSDRQ